MDIREEERLIKEAKKIKDRPNLPFGKLYEAYQPKVRGYFLSRLKEVAITEDLTSKTFAKALEGLDGFRWQGIPFSAWLFRIARNTFFDHLRSTRGKHKIEIEEAPPLKSDLYNPIEDLQEKEEEELLARSLLRLPSREREIIYLKFYEGLTNRAIAKVTGLSETNVGTILYRTLKRLREELS